MDIPVHRLSLIALSLLPGRRREGGTQMQLLALNFPNLEAAEAARVAADGKTVRLTLE